MLLVGRAKYPAGKHELDRASLTQRQLRLPPAKLAEAKHSGKTYGRKIPVYRDAAIQSTPV